MRIRSKPVVRGLRRWRADESGAMALEFALAVPILAAILAATLDLSFMFGAKRDAERLSTLMTKALASCPAPSSDSSATSQGTDCVTGTIANFIAQKPNILIGYPSATLGLAQFVKQSGSAYRMCPGNITDLDSGIAPIASIKSLVVSNLRPDDAGVAAYITINYTPFLPKFLAEYASTSMTTYMEVSVDVRGNGDGFKCY